MPTYVVFVAPFFAHLGLLTTPFYTNYGQIPHEFLEPYCLPIRVTDGAQKTPAERAAFEKNSTLVKRGGSEEWINERNARGLRRLPETFFGDIENGWAGKTFWNGGFRSDECLEFIGIAIEDTDGPQQQRRFRTGGSLTLPEPPCAPMNPRFVMVFKKQCTPFPPERESAQMERQFHRSVPFHPILDPAAISVKPQRSSSPRLDAYAYINGLNVLAESFFTSMSSADQLEVFRQRKADYETKSRQRRLTVTRGRDDAEANRRDDAASCLFDPLIWYFDSDLEMAELRLMEIAVGPKHAVAATQAPEVPVLPKRTLLDYLDYVLHDSWLNRPFPSSGGFPWY